MRPIASAKPNSIHVFVNGRRYSPYILTSSFTKPIKQENPLKRMAEPVLVTFIKNLSLIFKEGCVDCFMENLEKIEEQNYNYGI